MCRARIRWVRLFRTRTPNTLAADPAMPYFETAKPYVRGWFSATKRSFHDCTTPRALRRLVEADGLTVLYQYLHRYGRPDGSVDPRFAADAARLAAWPGLWVPTVGQALGRLQQMQGVVVATRGRDAWVANVHADPVADVQFRVPAGVAAAAPGAEPQGRRLRLPPLAPGGLLHLALSRPVRFAGPRTVALDAAGRGRLRLGLATAFVNAGSAPWRVAGLEVPPGAARLVGDPGYEHDPPLSVPGVAYRVRRMAGQAAVIARELVLRRRPLRLEAFLGAETIPLEDHANW